MKLWDVAELRLRSTLKARQDVWSIDFSPDGKTLAAGLSRGIQIWYVSREELVSDLEDGFRNGFSSMRFTQDSTLLAAAGHDGEVQIIDMIGSKPALAEPTRTLVGHTGEVSELAFSTKAGQLVSADHKGVLKQWDLDKGTETSSIKAHRLEIFSLATSPGGWAIAGSRDLHMSFWDLKHGKFTNLGTLKPHKDSITALAYSPTGGMMASGSLDRTLILWDTTTGAQKNTLTGHRGKIWTCAFAPDGKTLASACTRGEVKLWDVETANENQTFKIGGDIQSLAFTPDGKSLIVGNQSGLLVQQDLVTGETNTLTTTNSGTVRGLAVSSDGRLLAVARYSQTAELWDLTDRTMVAVVQAHPKHIRRILFSPDDKSLVTSGDSGRIKVWDVSRLFGDGIPGRAPYANQALVARGPTRANNPFPEFVKKLPPELRGVRGREATLRAINKLMDESYTAVDCGDWAAAARLRETACGLAGKQFGESRLAARHLAALATPYRQLARYEDARSILAFALQIVDTAEWSEDMAVAEVLGPMADIAMDTGDLVGAARIWERSVLIWDNWLEWCQSHERSPDMFLQLTKAVMATAEDRTEKVATAWFQVAGYMANGLPKQYKTKSDFFAAEVCYGRARLAQVYAQLGQFRRSNEHMTRSLELADKHFAEDHANMAPLYSVQAESLARQGQNAEAQKIMVKVIEIQKATIAPDAAILADSYRNLGEFQQRTGDLKAARASMETGIVISEKRFGVDHPFTADNRLALGRLYVSLKEYDRAEDQLTRGIRDVRKAFGPDNLEAILGTLTLGRLYADRGEWDDAIRHVSDGTRAFHKYAHTMLPHLSQYALADFLDYRVSDVKSQAMLVLHRAQDMPAARTLAAEVALNFKGMALEVLARRARTLRADQNPEVATAMQRLADARALLADKVASQATSEELTALAIRESEASREVLKLGGIAELGSPWVTLGEFQKVLPKGATAVQIVRAAWTFPGAGENQSIDQYMAWVVPADGEGDVAFVTLGDATAVDEKVRELQAAMTAAPQVIADFGDAKAEAAIRESLADVAGAVLSPIREHADDSERWFVSPDGPLWLVPWAAMPLDDDTYAVEKHTISYLVSGRELVQKFAPTSAGPALVLAAPDFQLNLLGASESPEPPAGQAEVGVGIRGGGDPYRRDWPPLDNVGMKREIEAARQGLRAFTGAEPWVFQGADAQEQIFKTAVRPKAVVFSTHGFYAPIPAGESGGEVLNALLRCGLVLAGANQRPTAATTTSDNGILTGLEIASADCRGTILVVLSACETGVGLNVDQEGVVGLRHAFHLAGVPSVAGSLWKVPDSETATLMTAFWSSLAKGSDHAQAMADAQRAVIQSARTGTGSSHPYLWAAFTITGNPFVDAREAAIDETVMKPVPLKPGDVVIVPPTADATPASDSIPVDLLKSIDTFKPRSDIEIAVTVAKGTDADDALMKARSSGVAEIAALLAEDGVLERHTDAMNDKVLPASKSFIVEEESTSKPSDDGVTVSLVAAVDPAKLRMALVDAGIPLKKKTGLFADQLADQARLARAGTLIRQLTTDYPFDCIRVEATGKQELLETVDGVAKVRVQVKYSVDSRAYGQFARKLLLVLQGCASYAKPFRYTYRKSGDTYEPIEVGYVERSKSIEYGLPDEIRKFVVKDGMDVFYFNVWCGHTRKSDEYDTRWLYVVLDESGVSALENAEKPVAFSVIGLDERGNRVSASTHASHEDVQILGSYRTGYTVGTTLGKTWDAVASPMLGYSALSQAPVIYDNIIVSIPVEQLKSIAKFSVVHATE